MCQQEINLPRKWSELSYAGECRVPKPYESSADSWPLIFLKKQQHGYFTDDDGNQLVLEVPNPDTIDFEGYQLDIVKEVLDNLSHEQVCIAEYWNAGPPTKQWTPIIDRLIDTYGVSANRAARILAAVHGGINDSTVITWYYKYKYMVARPNQFDQTLATICCTPNHPSYPAGHGVIAGCTKTILGYFFAPEQDKLNILAEQCAMSRVYAGVHYPADVEVGLELGRQIGNYIVAILDKQVDKFGAKVDIPITVYHDAQLMPPPYKQVIPYKRGRSCQSLLDPRQCPEAR